VTLKFLRDYQRTCTTKIGNLTIGSTDYRLFWGTMLQHMLELHISLDWHMYCVRRLTC